MTNQQITEKKLNFLFLQCQLQLEMYPKVCPLLISSDMPEQIRTFVRNRTCHVTYQLEISSVNLLTLVDQSQSRSQNSTSWLVHQLWIWGGNFKMIGHVTSLIIFQDSSSQNQDFKYLWHWVIFENKKQNFFWCICNEAFIISFELKVLLKNMKRWRQLNNNNFGILKNKQCLLFWMLCQRMISHLHFLPPLAAWFLRQRYNIFLISILD